MQPLIGKDIYSEKKNPLRNNYFPHKKNLFWNTRLTLYKSSRCPFYVIYKMNVLKTRERVQRLRNLSARRLVCFIKPKVNAAVHQVTLEHIKLERLLTRFTGKQDFGTYPQN